MKNNNVQQKTGGSNVTPKMTKYERAQKNLLKLCFSKHGPVVNYQHITAEMNKIKLMDMKGVK